MSLRIFRSQPTCESANAPTKFLDPIEQLPHQRNRELFKYLEDRWQQQGLPSENADKVTLSLFSVIKSFEQLADNLTTIGDVKKLTAYGVRLAAGADNLVFTWAQGPDEVFVKLLPAWHEAAQADGGRLDDTYPSDWVEFIVGGGRMPSAIQRQWRAVIQHWMQVAYDESRADAINSLSAKPQDEARQRRAAITLAAANEPHEIKEANVTRITLTLTAPENHFDSLTPLYRALAEPVWLEAANQYRIRTGQGATVVSKNDLSIGLPPKRSRILSVLFEGPPVEVVIRGNLSDLLAASEKLANWLTHPHKRKVKLEIWDTNRVEAEAQNPEQLQQLFQTAIEYEKRKSAS